MDPNLLQYLGWQNQSLGSFQKQPFQGFGYDAQKYRKQLTNAIMPIKSKAFGINTSFDTPGSDIFKFGQNTTEAKGSNLFKSGLDWLKKDAAKTDVFGRGNGVMQTIGQLNGVIPSNPETSNSLTQGLDTAYDMTADTLSQIPGVGSVVGGVMKVAGFASDALNSITGGKTTIENASNTADKIMSSKWLSLTPIGLFNSLGKKTVEGSNEDLAKTVNQGYNATEGIGDTDIGGISRLFKKSLVTGRQKNVNYINAQNAGKSSAIYKNKLNMLASNNSIADIANRNRAKQSGGMNTNILAARKGTKLVQTSNVIPSGALHARKNNLPEEIAKDVTHKGIPVVSEKADGGLIQHAEIEHSEIIFNKSVTNQLENLLKKFEDGDENAAIEAGKLLTYEILENTDDNTNLINTIQ